MDALNLHDTKEFNANIKRRSFPKLLGNMLTTVRPLSLTLRDNAKQTNKILLYDHEIKRSAK